MNRYMVEGLADGVTVGITGRLLYINSITKLRGSIAQDEQQYFNITQWNTIDCYGARPDRKGSRVLDRTGQDCEDG